MTFTQPAILRKSRHPIIDVAVDPVGESFFQHRADHLKNLRHVFRGPRFNVRSADAQPFHVTGVRLHIFLDDSVPGDAFLRRPVDDLIIHVGEVFDVGHVIPSIHEIPPEHVKDDRTSGMAHMTFIVHGDTADVDAHAGRRDGNERFFLIRQGVENLHGAFIQGSAKRKGSGPFSFAV